MSQIQGSPKILIVDDKPQNLFALEKLLKSLGNVEVVQTTSGLEALSLTLEHDFGLAIVDIQMPEMDGYELVELLRGNPSTSGLPVIFISAIFSDEYHHRKGYDAGAVDFLSKPFVPEILLSKVRVFLSLYQQRIKLEELAEQNAQLYELEKKLRAVEEARAQDLVNLNASKDKFFSIVSHDLRTPFNGLIGSAQLMLMDLEENNGADVKELAEVILESAQSAYRLLENLLAWSRIQRGVMESQPEMLSLDGLAQSTVDLLQQTAVQKEIELASVVEPGTLIYADENMLRTVLRNLVSNALKFTPAGGRVTISARQCAGNGREAAPHTIELAVTDSGVGIEEEDLAKLFKIDVHHSTTGTAAEQGAGIGLILCQEMVALNGGRIWVESQIGRGTTVRFTVPLAEEMVSA